MSELGINTLHDPFTVEDAVKRAREVCGCAHCYGSYDIGARTLAMGSGSTRPRPSSCLAAVILAAELKAREQ